MTNEELEAALHRFLQRRTKQIELLEAKTEGTLEEGGIDWFDLLNSIRGLAAMSLLDPDAPCAFCSYFGETPEMVCALHPEGPEGNSCPDFEDLNKSSS